MVARRGINRFTNQVLRRLIRGYWRFIDHERRTLKSIWTTTECIGSRGSPSFSGNVPQASRTSALNTADRRLRSVKAVLVPQSRDARIVAKVAEVRAEDIDPAVKAARRALAKLQSPTSSR
jgi:hypothetical protein